MSVLGAAMLGGGTVLIGLTGVRVRDQRDVEAELQALVRTRKAPPQRRVSLRQITGQPSIVASSVHDGAPRGDRSPVPRPEAALQPVQLVARSIDLDAPVVPLGFHEEDGEFVWDTADHAVGYHLGTAKPGEPGNCVLSGHLSSPRRGQGNIFHNLPYVLPGQDVVVATPGNGRWAYNVAQTNVVDPEDIWAIGQTNEPTLTLVTCVPEGRWTHRLVVICDSPVRV